MPRFIGKASHDKEIERAWNNNELAYVAGQQDAIAHALNLQEGNAAASCPVQPYVEPRNVGPNPARIRRSGNKAKRVFRHIPIIRDSTDEDRWYALKHKHSGQKALFDALKARRGIR
jgi:hypothetical protein